MDKTLSKRIQLVSERVIHVTKKIQTRLEDKILLTFWQMGFKVTGHYVLSLNHLAKIARDLNLAPL